MAQFFQYAAGTPDGVDVVAAAWCKSRPVLAVGTGGKQLHFVNDEGEKVRGGAHGGCAAPAAAPGARARVFAVGE